MGDVTEDYVMAARPREVKGEGKKEKFVAVGTHNTRYSVRSLANPPRRKTLEAAIKRFCLQEAEESNKGARWRQQ